MDPFTLISAATAIGGFAASLFGGDGGPTGAELGAAAMQNKISGQISGISKQEENLRKQAATSDYIGSVRSTMRNAQVAQASALASAVNGGAQQSSGLLGGRGQIGGQAGDQIAGVTGDYLAGQQIFDLNNQITDLQTQYNYWGAKAGQLAQQRPQNIGGALIQLGTSGVANGEKLTNAFAGAKNMFSGLFNG